MAASAVTTRTAHPHAGLAAVTRTVADRVAQRLVEALQRDAERREHANEAVPGTALDHDAQHQALLIGRWIAEELVRVNEARLRDGDAPLDAETERLLHERVAADLTGAGLGCQHFADLPSALRCSK